MDKKINDVQFRFFTWQSYYNFGKGYDRVEKVSSNEVVHFLEYAKVKEGGALEDVKQAIARNSNGTVTIFIPQQKFETSGIRTLYHNRLKWYLPKGYTVQCHKGFFTVLVNGEKMEGVKSLEYTINDKSYISQIQEEAQNIKTIKGGW